MERAKKRKGERINPEKHLEKDKDDATHLAIVFTVIYRGKEQMSSSS